MEQTIAQHLNSIRMKPHVSDSFERSTVKLKLLRTHDASYPPSRGCQQWVNATCMSKCNEILRSAGSFGYLLDARTDPIHPASVTEIVCTALAARHKRSTLQRVSKHSDRSWLCSLTVRHKTSTLQRVSKHSDRSRSCSLTARHKRSTLQRVSKHSDRSRLIMLFFFLESWITVVYVWIHRRGNHCRHCAVVFIRTHFAAGIPLPKHIHYEYFLLADVLMLSMFSTFTVWYGNRIINESIYNFINIYIYIYITCVICYNEFYYNELLLYVELRHHLFPTSQMTSALIMTEFNK